MRASARRIWAYLDGVSSTRNWSIGFVFLLLPFCGESQETDHTTYVVRTESTNPEILTAIEAAGGVIDHFDGTHVRSYILHEYWDAFLGTNIPYTLESIQPIPKKQRTNYPTYAEIGTILSDIAAANPTLCQLTSIGRSTLDREIWALLITDNPGIEEDEPEFAYLSTIHGDETPGTVFCLNFIDLLLSSYNTDPTLTRFVNETEIWIIPLLNPDGYELGIRWNANNLDLNRSFPQWPTDFVGTIATEGPPDTTGRQAEVARIMDWTASRSLVLGANYHTGALVINYPYDEIPGISSGQEAPTLDDALMRSLAREYADLNPPMLASPTFPGGITNGSAWFRISGGMQDWHYRYAGVIDFTFEVSNVKDPSPGNLLGLWDDNRDAMIAYLSRVHRGIRGLVTDGVSGEPLAATVVEGDNPQPVFTDPDVGDYYRLLLPGTYTLRAESPGYIPYTAQDISTTGESATRVDFALSKGDVNGDGQVNATDLQLVINTILGRTTAFNADLDGGGVSATDLQHVVNRVLGRP